ncbi:MAG: ABC transporter ATP-binding protein [Clostridia bacterium]|nr:ABC transporter ATP-binding protein [Clostridia bacterium]
MEKEILISIKDLYKTYRSGDIYTPVLKGVNFDIFKGEFICILGESGSGKSTILNIIGGLVNADSGSIKFKNKEIINLSEKELTKHRRNNIGYIFQNYNLLPSLTAKQNLDIIAELTNSPADSEEMLKSVGLEDKIKSYPSQLSGGQQQRVSIARALIKKPILILADEPTAALDCETSKEVLEVFENVVKNGTTLVVVTHNENITKMANRIIKLRNGIVYKTIENENPIKAKELEW